MENYGTRTGRKAITPQQKQTLIDQLWLHYYNQTLYDKGMISERDYSRMKARINSRTMSAPER